MQSIYYVPAGAGKTEITLESICWALSLGKKVGFAISRRQVVVEIAGRLKKNFPELSVIAVCEGFTEITDADLIVCTTHQLYRYAGCFDLLILDELEPFPMRAMRCWKTSQPPPAEATGSCFQPPPMKRACSR